MTTNDDKVSGIPEMPTLKAGEHRERLKAELMAAHGSRGWTMPGWMRAAAMVTAGALLMGAGVMVKDAYNGFRMTSVGVELGTTYLDADGKPTDAENATTTISRSQPFNNLTSDGEAQKRVKEWSDGIAGKQYRFVREFDDSNGERQYEYVLKLADGREDKLSATVRLEDVSSWEQWQERQQVLFVQRYQQFLQAVKDGKVHIVADDVITIHVCLDVASGKKIDVFRGHLPDGTLYAGVEDSPRTSISRMGAWQEHLDALSQGKRKLLKVTATPTFTYEYLLPDGKMVRNTTGGIPIWVAK